jgi:hypothetical protein
MLTLPTMRKEHEKSDDEVLEFIAALLAAGVPGTTLRCRFRPALHATQQTRSFSRWLTSPLRTFW